MGPVQLGPIEYVLRFARERDRAEIEATVGFKAALDLCHAWSDQAVLLRMFEHHGHPAAFIAAHERNCSTVELSLVATDHWPHVALSVAKCARRDVMPALLAKGYRRAECRAIDGHPEAQAFLEFLGFTLECRCPEFGRGGETFLQYAWRSRDHVHSAKVSGPA